MTCISNSVLGYCDFESKDCIFVLEFGYATTACRAGSWYLDDYNENVDPVTVERYLPHMTSGGEEAYTIIKTDDGQETKVKHSDDPNVKRAADTWNLMRPF